MTIDVSATLSAVRAAHKTAKYKTDALVVRRGFSVSLSTPSTSLSLALIPVRSTNRLDGSYSVTVSVDSSSLPGWALSQPSSDTLSLTIPADAPVGLYRLADDDSAVPLVVLFNPYSPDDAVHLPDAADAREYVQAEAGRMWRGSSNSFSGMPWTFAQFRLKVLVSALDLLDKLPVDERADPVQVGRQLSALLNSSDADNGVIVGNWSGDYDDGVSPTAWTGSFEVLQSYWDSGSRPVKYGQCWVFAGVFTSVLRTLGIPSMPVSNFASAHESKPYNRVLEHYYNEDGEPMPDRARGSTWNFHAWTMAWMKRPDLSGAMEKHGLDYNGWQVVDGTPQERSEGVYQLGPTPVLAVKHGYETDYDADFVIGEVNADKAYYVQRSSGKFEEFSRDTRTVGQKLSVKAVGRDARNDVTDWYKFREGSAKEREAFRNRVKGLSVEPEEAIISSRAFRLPSFLRRAVGADTAEDVEFKVTVADEVDVGQEVSYLLKVTMGSGQKVKVTVTAAATEYTGASLGTLARETVELSESGEVPLLVPAASYAALLAKGMTTVLFDTAAFVTSDGSDNSTQTWAHEALVRVSVNSVLDARVGDTVASSVEEGTPLAVIAKGEEVTVTVLIDNSTGVDLSGAVLRAEGEGLLKDVLHVDVGEVAAGEAREEEITLTGIHIGDRLLVMTLDTKEIMDVARSLHMAVKAAPEAEAAAPEEEEDDEHGWEADDAEAVADVVEVEVEVEA